MSKLDELISQYCPNGVEYKTIEELCEVQNGYTPSKKVSEYWDNGDFPWFRMEDIRANGKELSDSIQHVNLAGVKGKGFPAYSIIFATTATIGEHALITVPFICNQQLTHIHIRENIKSILDIRFLFYYSDIIDELCKKNTKGGSTLPAVSLDKFKQFLVPVPPLEVQREIVHILDNFTELTAELTTELTAEFTARKKQYEFYRNKLLTFESDISCVPLKDVAIIERGTRVVRNQLSDSGEYPVYQNALTPMGYYEDFNRNANNTFMICAGAAGQIGFSVVDFWAADDCYTFKCNENIDNKYLFHVLKNNQYKIDSKVRKASIPRISRESVGNILVPVPELKVQKRIVNVLDNFESICTDLNIGLPAEIEARQKQYEYYRDLLLTFAAEGATILTDRQTDRQTVRQTDRQAIIRLLQYVFGYAPVKLNEIFNTKNGYTPAKSNSEYWNTYDIPWFKMEDIRENGRILTTALQGVSKSAVKGKAFPANSFIISTSATIGEYALVTCDFLCNQRFTCLMIKEEYKDLFNIKFLYYYFHKLALHCKNSLNQGNFSSVDMAKFNEFEFPIISLEEQEKIVSILDRFDTLCNDLSAGLPAEIEAREKQYEYYRDKLLSFKELPK